MRKLLLISLVFVAAAAQAARAQQAPPDQSQTAPPPQTQQNGSAPEKGHPLNGQPAPKPGHPLDPADVDVLTGKTNAMQAADSRYQPATYWGSPYFPGGYNWQTRLRWSGSSLWRPFRRTIPVFRSSVFGPPITLFGIGSFNGPRPFFFGGGQFRTTPFGHTPARSRFTLHR